MEKLIKSFSTSPNIASNLSTTYFLTATFFVSTTPLEGIFQNDNTRPLVAAVIKPTSSVISIHRLDVMSLLTSASMNLFCLAHILSNSSDRIDPRYKVLCWLYPAWRLSNLLSLKASIRNDNVLSEVTLNPKNLISSKVSSMFSMLAIDRYSASELMLKSSAWYASAISTKASK